MLTALEMLGLVAFAGSGALAAVRARLDLFGVIVVGLTTVLGGGVIRDILLGIHPPTTLRTWPYLAVCAITALAVFVFHPQVARCAGQCCWPTHSASACSPRPAPRRRWRRARPCMRHA